MELRTIKTHVQNQIVIEKSRFICDLFPVSSEKEAKDILNSIKEEHPKAVHHCYAYVIKEEFQNIENQSDDGEPSKTAGLPMLEILRYEKLVNVIAIVTRYFGGTLLGTGGLVRAYSSSVKKAVDLSDISIAILMQGYIIKVPYSFNKLVDYELKRFNAHVKSIEYLEEVEIEFYTDSLELIDIIKEKTNNLVDMTVTNKVYI